MADAEGNVIRPPSISAERTYTPTEILASYARFTQRGCTVEGGHGVIAAGTVMGRKTANKKYVAYASANTDGSETPLGVLRNDVDTGTVGAPLDAEGDIVISGILKLSMLSGLDAGAITALNGRTDSDADEFIF